MGYSPWGRKESDTTEATAYARVHEGGAVGDEAEGGAALSGDQPPWGTLVALHGDAHLHLNPCQSFPGTVSRPPSRKATWQGALKTLHALVLPFSPNDALASGQDS